MTRRALSGGWLPFLAALAGLLIVYLPTVQPIPAGSGHYTMLDTGETQIVLNVWGTLHATGYPLYVMTGSALVAALRLAGVGPATAPALVSLLWGVLALAVFYALLRHLTGRTWASAVVIVLFGLMRTVWIHQVIAEVYSFGLLILVGLLALALWRAPVRGRILGLALLGGIGVGHHRALAFTAPALIVAAWPSLWRGDSGGTSPASWRAGIARLAQLAVAGLPLAAAGVFLPYLYLWARARAGAAWVYGDPSTLAGLWAQFSGEEAGRYIGLPGTWDALQANLALVNSVLLTDLTLPGLLAGLAGLIVALWEPHQRRAAVALLLNAAVPYTFHVLFYQDVLSALILPILVSAAGGWLLLADRLLRLAGERPAGRARLIPVGLLAVAVLAAGFLLGTNGPFIAGLVSDPAGLKAIATAAGTPPGATLMIPWGVQYFAVRFAQDVDPALAPGLRNVPIVDHRTDLLALARDGILVVPAETLWNQPPAWWEARLGQLPVAQAAAPGLVQIGLTPGRIADPPDSFGPAAERITCAAGRVILEVMWYTPETPAEDLSVFVHALDANGTILAQADQIAPVYGWRPLTTWRAGEAVRDVYALDADPATVRRVRYGLYRITAAGFENVYTYTVEVNCPPEEAGLRF
ncbi:MAG: DUF2723 domain-containing protein [Anaerolineae bacterium]|nr:DUF2723 domain-containing protein [Anaerolineae bacterium]